jgi:hypothetical protein
MRSTPLPDIYQGDDYTAIAFISKDGIGIPLTGFTGPAAQLRRNVADIDTAVDATFACSISGTSTVTLTLPKATTVALTGCYVYDLQITDPTGHLVTIAKGPAHVIQEVTRP